MERMVADVEGDVVRVIDLRKRIQADIRNLGKRERALEARREAIDERAKELDQAQVGQISLIPPVDAHTTGASGLRDRAARKAAILQRMKGA